MISICAASQPDPPQGTRGGPLYPCSPSRPHLRRAGGRGGAQFSASDPAGAEECARGPAGPMLQRHGDFKGLVIAAATVENLPPGVEGTHEPLDQGREWIAGRAVEKVGIDWSRGRPPSPAMRTGLGEQTDIGRWYGKLYYRQGFRVVLRGLVVSCARSVRHRVQRWPGRIQSWMQRGSCPSGRFGRGRLHFSMLAADPGN